MSESQTVTGILRYLTLLENQGKLIVMRNNTGAFIGEYIDKQGRKRTRLVRFGKRGSPDVLVWLPGRSIFLEVKSRTGQQTKAQQEFQKQAESIGVEYYVVRSIDKVRKIINR